MRGKTVADKERKLRITYTGESGKIRTRKHLHGPNQAIAVANSEPNNWPNVAPAPINPNNLEPD